MENERPSKRHSLLPQRSASGFSNREGDVDESNKLVTPSVSKNRDVSPSKLPVGGLKRTQPARQAASSSKTASSRQPTHKSQASSISLTKGDVSASTASGRAASALQTPSSRRALGLARPNASTSKSASKTILTPKPQSTGHRQTPSVSERETRSAASASTRTLANVKVQRPASAIIQKPSSPKKPSKSSTPSVNKFSLLSGPVVSALKPVHELKLELLHLHMLHRSSQETKEQWTASAKDHYEKTFGRLVSLEDDLRSNEIDFLEQRNAAALIAWCKEVSSVMGESKTEVLSGVLDQMWMLVAPGGRYTASVSAFEDWYAIMEKSHDLRSLGQERQHIDIMEGLGDGWKNEVDGIMNNLCIMSDALENLGPAVEPSDLARCLNVLMTLLANMLDELMLIRDIEQKLVDREEDWIKSKINSLSAQISGDQ